MEARKGPYINASSVMKGVHLEERICTWRLRALSKYLGLVLQSWDHVMLLI